MTTRTIVSCLVIVMLLFPVQRVSPSEERIDEVESEFSASSRVHRTRLLNEDERSGNKECTLCHRGIVAHESTKCTSCHRVKLEARLLARPQKSRANARVGESILRAFGVTPYTRKIRSFTVVGRYVAHVSAYNPVQSQTDHNPSITASGETVHWGVVATNGLPLGRFIRIPDLGNQVFKVSDRMGCSERDPVVRPYREACLEALRKGGVGRILPSDARFDILFPEENGRRALQFGRRSLTVEVLSPQS